MSTLVLHFYPGSTVCWQCVGVYFIFQSENTMYLNYSLHLCVITEVGTLYFLSSRLSCGGVHTHMQYLMKKMVPISLKCQIFIFIMIIVVVEK